MPGWSYSSEEFYKDWRYGLEEDFKTESGENYPYAEPNGHVEWGSEIKKISFNADNFSKVVASDDGKYLAIATDNNIHIIKTSTFETWQVLRGHTDRVDCIAFKPKDSNILISSAQNHYGGTAAPKIIFWDLAKAAEQGLSEDEFNALTENLAQTSIKATDATLGGPNDIRETAHWSDTEKTTLQTALIQQFSSIVTARAAPTENQLKGRLTPSFQSEMFSPSGTYLLYLPGLRPKSNRTDDGWTVSILHFSTRKTIATLKEHTDAIMWTGFDPTETLIATVAWDSRICIWDWSAVQASSENEPVPVLAPKYTFDTDGQNWAGAFSPDSMYFVGTVGTGKVHIYSMHDGSKVQTYDRGSSCWLRTVAWDPHRKERDQIARLCVGGRGNFGELLMLEIGQDKPVQSRKLSLDNALIEGDKRRGLIAYLEMTKVRYAAGGRFLVTLTGGDGGVEVYDLVEETKWRIARGGVDLDLEKAGTGEIDAVYVESMVHWEMNGKLWIGVLGGKDLRVWAIPLEKD